MAPELNGRGIFMKRYGFLIVKLQFWLILCPYSRGGGLPVFSAFQIRANIDMILSCVVFVLRSLPAWFVAGTV